MFRIAGKNRKQRTGAADSWGYKIHDGAAQFRFELEGALAVGDVAELDQCWRTAASSIAGKTWVVDLTSLTAIDESGRQLLNRWRQAGAEFVAGPEFVAANGGSILGDCALRSTDVRATRLLRPSFHTALPWLAVLAALLLPHIQGWVDSRRPAEHAAHQCRSPHVAALRGHVVRQERAAGVDGIDVDTARSGTGVVLIVGVTQLPSDLHMVDAFIVG